MRLHYTQPSPYARKVMVAAEELGLSDRITLVEVTGTAPTEANADLTRENPLKKVPVLVLEDGRSIIDSIVIAEYFQALAGGDRLFPHDEQRWPCLTLHALADGIMDAGVLVRLEGVRPVEKQWDDWVEAQRGKVIGAIDAIEADPSLFAGRLNIGQIGLVCALEWIAFREVYTDIWDGRPQLTAWFKAVCERPSFVASRPR